MIPGACLRRRCAAPSRAAVTAWVRRALEYPPAAWPPERFFRIDARDGHVVVLPERNSHLESALSVRLPQLRVVVCDCGLRGV